MNQPNKYFVRGERFRGVVLAFTAADAIVQWELRHKDHVVAEVWPCLSEEATCEQLDRFGGWLSLPAEGIFG